MSDQLVPFSFWSERRMRTHLDERMEDMFHTGEGLWMEEDVWYAAVFLCGFKAVTEDGYMFFTYCGHNFYNGDYTPEEM